VAGKDGRLPPSAEEEDPAAAQAALLQLVELGYIPPPDNNVQRTIALAETEADFNLAVTLMEGGRAREAKEIFVRLTNQSPNEPRYWRAGAGVFAGQTPLEANSALRPWNVSSSTGRKRSFCAVCSHGRAMT
jgi:hypothetical protein